MWVSETQKPHFLPELNPGSALEMPLALPPPIPTVRDTLPPSSMTELLPVSHHRLPPCLFRPQIFPRAGCYWIRCRLAVHPVCIPPGMCSFAPVPCCSRTLPPKKQNGTLPTASLHSEPTLTYLLHILPLTVVVSPLQEKPAPETRDACLLSSLSLSESSGTPHPTQTSCP